MVHQCINSPKSGSNKPGHDCKIYGGLFGDAHTDELAEAREDDEEAEIVLQDDPDGGLGAQGSGF